MSGQEPDGFGVPPNMGEEIDERNAQLELDSDQPERAEEERSDGGGAGSWGVGSCRRRCMRRWRRS